MQDPSEQFPVNDRPTSNVLWGPRCGEYWPDPTPTASGQEEAALPVTYVSVSATGVLDLYLWGVGQERWRHAASTTKGRLLDEYRRREGR